MSSRKNKQSSTKKSNSSRGGNKKAAQPKLLSKPKSAPVSRSAKQQNKGPQIRALSGGGCVISHSELVANLSSISTPSFQLLKRLRCNPASIGTFNWLSQMAPNYETYKFHKLHFRYETRSPTTVGGSVIMSPDYDAADGEVGVNETALYNNRGSVDDSIWKQMILKLEPSSMNRLYKSHVVMSDVRFAQTSQDAKTIDVAQVFIGTDCQTALNLGKLFVDYTVELTIPASVQESVGQGGIMSVNPVVRLATNDGVILNPLSTAATDVVSPPLKWLNELVADGVCTQANPSSPQYTACKFLKDWQGVASLVQSSTGASFTAPSILSIMKDPLGNNAPANTVPTALNSIDQEALQRTTLGNATTDIYQVIAKAGDYLKIRAQTPQAPSGISQSLYLALGAASAAYL